jgi:hypothetical protein
MKFLQLLKTAVIVLFMTLIVWVAADRAVLRTSPDLDIPVEVNSSSANYRVTVVEPAEAVLRLRFRGPGHVIDSLDQRQPRLAYRCTITSAEAARAAGPGGQGQLILTLRQGFESLAREGASAEAVGAGNVVVRVEAVGQIKVRVALSQADRSQMAEALALKPPEVLATVPVAALDRARDEQLFAVPVLNLEDPQLRAGGQSVQRAILRPSLDNLAATFTPPDVEVTLRLLTPMDKSTLNGVRIQVEGPPDLFARYDVVLVDPLLNNLKLKGPKADLDALKPDDVKAVLVLKSDDKPNEGSPKVRPLDLRFPDGSRVRLDADSPPNVNFNLKERAVPESPKIPGNP